MIIYVYSTLQHVENKFTPLIKSIKLFSFISSEHHITDSQFLKIYIFVAITFKKKKSTGKVFCLKIKFKKQKTNTKPKVRECAESEEIPVSEFKILSSFSLPSNKYST